MIQNQTRERNDYFVAHLDGIIGSKPPDQRWRKLIPFVAELVDHEANTHRPAAAECALDTAYCAPHTIIIAKIDPFAMSRLRFHTHRFCDYSSYSVYESSLIMLRILPACVLQNDTIC
jgi:hypothetical protein